MEQLRAELDASMATFHEFIQNESDKVNQNESTTVDMDEDDDKVEVVVVDDNQSDSVTETFYGTDDVNE